MKMNKFSNINTFMGMENPYDKSDIVVYGAGFDGTTSNRPGARFASSSMRPEFYGLETYSPILELDLEDFKICDMVRIYDRGRIRGFHRKRSAYQCSGSQCKGQ